MFYDVLTYIIYLHFQLSRGRSFSTTLTPKLDTGAKDHSSVGNSVLPVRRDSILKGNTGDPAPTPGVAVPLRRKKSVPTGRGDSRYVYLYGFSCAVQLKMPTVIVSVHACVSFIEKLYVV